MARAPPASHRTCPPIPPCAPLPPCRADAGAVLPPPDLPVPGAQHPVQRPGADRRPRGHAGPACCARRQLCTAALPGPEFRTGGGRGGCWWGGVACRAAHQACFLWPANAAPAGRPATWRHLPPRHFPPGVLQGVWAGLCGASHLPFPAACTSFPLQRHTPASTPQGLASHSMAPRAPPCPTHTHPTPHPHTLPHPPSPRHHPQVSPKVSGLDAVVREVLAQQARNPGGPALEVRRWPLGRGCPAHGCFNGCCCASCLLFPQLPAGFPPSVADSLTLDCDDSCVVQDLNH